MKQKIGEHIENPDYIDKARYDVSRNLFILLAVILGLVGILNLAQRDINYIPLLFGTGISLMCLGILLRWRNYKLAAYMGMIMAFGLTIYNMCITSNYGHFVDFLWIMVIAIYIFFVLGNTWGVINLFLNIGAVMVVLYLVRVGIVEQVEKPFTNFSQFNFILNCIISGSVFTYITIKVLNALRKTEKAIKEANTELVRSNHEKTIMLKEIHHRVKNNLQVITSLLRLQLHEVEDEESRHHFNNSINRVSAMAIIHEKMYQSEALSRIDLESYLNTLIDDLISSYAVNTEIKTSITSNVQHISPESIVPLALIFNELISNSLEHAFKQIPTGIINVDIKRNEDRSITMHYSDNGVWVKPQKDASFGNELIESFVEQLDGTCKREVLESGTHYYFEFPKQL